MKLTKITAAAVAALTIAGAGASTASATVNLAPAQGTAQLIGGQLIFPGDVVGAKFDISKNPNILDIAAQMIGDYNAGVEAGKENLFRMYNPNSGEHFYTVNIAEALNVLVAGWNYEGTLGSTQMSGAVAVYRLYNPNTTGPGAHYYTVNTNEVKNLVSLGWKAENVAFIDAGPASIYVVYNPNSGEHFLTNSTDEVSHLLSLGWSEGYIGFHLNNSAV
ncbi:hypothetical protein [Lactovum odontotermitis]